MNVKYTMKMVERGLNWLSRETSYFTFDRMANWEFSTNRADVATYLGFY